MPEAPPVTIATLPASLPMDGRGVTSARPRSQPGCGCAMRVVRTCSAAVGSHPRRRPATLDEWRRRPRPDPLHGQVSPSTSPKPSAVWVTCSPAWHTAGDGDHQTEQRAARARSEELVERRHRLLERDHLDAALVPAPPTEVKEVGPGAREVLAEEPQRAQVFAPDACAALHLERDEAALAVEDEVDLIAPAGPPVVQRVAEAAVVVEGPELLEEERLQRRSLHLLRHVQRAARADRAEHARVEEVELRMRDEPAFGPPGEHGQPDGDQQILEDREVVLDDLRAHAAVPGDGRHVEHAALREAR